MFTSRSILFALSVTAAYFIVSYVLIGFRGDQVALALIFNIPYFASKKSREFILAFSVFIIYWIIFDFMKAFPNYRYNEVHIKDLYEAEKAVFGFGVDGIRITPNEYFSQHSSTFTDLLAGLFYLCWIPVPLAFAGWLYAKRRSTFQPFAICFLIVNLIGFCGYYLYPAAPPWYVSEYGYTFNAATPGNVAGLGRFDAMTGIPVFAALYSKSSNVFAAMPSLHAAYMLIVVWFAYLLRLRTAVIFYTFITLGIWFTAVYSNHHYVMDVLAGIGCTIAGAGLTTLIFKSWRTGLSNHRVTKT